MNKTELVNAIAQGAGLTKADSKKALDAALDAIAGALKNKEAVALANDMDPAAGEYMRKALEADDIPMIED